MAKVQHSPLDPGKSVSAVLMADAASGHLYVNLSASEVRRRLKGHGFGVRRIEAAGKGRTVIVHTATGKHLRQLEGLFQGAVDHTGEQVDQATPTGPDSITWGAAERGPGE